MQQTEAFSGRLSSDVHRIMNVIGHNFDVVLRQFFIEYADSQAALLYIHGQADIDTIHSYIIKPLLRTGQGSGKSDGFSLKRCIAELVEIGEMLESPFPPDAVRCILSGDAVLLVDGLNECFMFAVAKSPSRQVEESVTESLVRGSREGFVERLSVNISLLRGRIKDPAFTMVKYEVGRRSRTGVVVAYIANIADKQIVEEVKRRIEKIDIDEIPESGYIEQLIEDHHITLFPQVINTERPDKAATALMKGKVAILTDGTPIALLVPITFSMLLHSPEDNYERWWIGSLLRVLRYVIVFFALFLPSIYIALVSFQQGLIPTKLAISITTSREGVPFPTFVEALIMEMTIEILREAGIRLPKPIGQAVGIVGGLVIGQSAVEAGIVSPIMVIVVALTAISSFAFPHYSAAIAIRILRFVMMLAAALFGLYGLIMASVLLIGHLAKLKSFGVDYAGTSMLLKPGMWKDSVLRFPLQWLNRRSTLKPPKRLTQTNKD